MIHNTYYMYSLSNEFTKAQQAFLSETWTPILIFGKVCGIDLEKYNNYKTGYSPDLSSQQQVINEGVLHLNQAISVLNSAVNTIAPLTSDEVHSFHNKHHTHKYHKMYDGLHPYPTLMTRWAHLIIKSLKKNLHL